MDTKNKLFTVIGSVALIATAGIGGATLFASKDDTASTTTGATVSSTTLSSSTLSESTSASTDTSPNSNSSTSHSSYKDGTYTASTTYIVPHGATNSISATVVVSEGTITSVKANDSYTDRESGMWISDFESSLSSDASGQSLSSYSPSRIGGASLTTEAFSSVLDEIRSQAVV